ncbi:C-type mannose receptor 2-like [Sardina pilchardus]|uniref:C-type mannose receptor 2-like n=1 Tax=Sardina pilchardus TaxID=27697 RepID=UPI002E1458CF
MERVLPFVLLISGFSGVILCKPEYHFVNETKNWIDAQTHCRNAYIDLATIHDMEDISRVKSIIKNEKSAVWIGLYKTDVDLWKWSLEDKSLYSPGEYEFRNWDTTQPTLEPNEECVRALEGNGKWHDAACDEQHIFFCYDENLNATLINESKTGHSAKAYCREKYKDLASIRNLKENQQLHEIAQKKSFWIGLIRDSWKWSDGSNSSFQYWSSGELFNPVNSNEYCAVITPSDGLWGDRTCTALLPFLCQKEKEIKERKTIKVKLKSETAINMEDPKVQAAILQQIHERLQLSSDVKVTWKKQADGNVFHENKERKKKRKREDL